MARKRSSAKDGGGGGAFSPGGSGEGEGSTASSSSPAPGSYAQPQAATSSTTSSSKVLPSLSRPRDNDGSSSEPEHPSKKLKSSANELQGKIADDAEQSLHPDHDTQQISRSPLQDLTAIVIEGADNDGDASEIRSAFGFSPANPPAANIAWSSSNLWPSHLPPQDGLATSASAQKWKMSGTQRHVDSFKFFSRDVLSRSAMPQLDLDYDDQAVHYGIRVDSFDVTGGLVWLQAEPYATLTPYDIDTSRVVRGSTFLDGAGRSSATQRYIGTTEEKQWETACDRSERVDYHLYESYLGFSRHLHPQLNCSPWTDIKLHRFDPKSLRLRGLAGTDSELTKEGHWSEYGMPEYQTVLSATCSPSLLADAACYEVLHPTKYFKTGGKRPTELHVVLRFEAWWGDHEDEDNWSGALMGSWLGSIHWAPSGKTVRRISPPHDDEHCAAAISEGTGYCWTGYSDGRIELFDPSAYSFEVITQRPSPNNVHSARGILPDFQVVLTASETRGWVTSLVTAGPVEVVATFSKGVMLLLRATSPRTIEIVREFVGFVNEGGYTRNCIHADSRLVAVAAWGQPVRIWHLDDTYPLNSAWHRQRRGLKALDLLPKPRSKDKQPDRATSTTNDAQSTLAPIDAATTAPSSGSDGPDAALVSTIAPSNASTPYSATAAWDDPPPDDAASIASSTSKKETKSASTGQTAARGKGRPKPCGTLLELLARRSITDKKAKKAAQERFGDLIPEQSCGMTFAPTSWVADRDAQWEMTRDFEGDDGDGGLRPKAISAGLLPSIVCGTSSLRGPMLIYFEPERKAGVEIKDDGEVGSAQNEEVKKEKKSVEGAKGGEQEGGGSSTSLLAQS